MISDQSFLIFLSLFFIFGYFVGSIPFGLILTKAYGLGDIRKIGSGNIGATNVLRTGNKKIALMTLLLDGIKGAFAIFLTQKAFNYEILTRLNNDIIFEIYDKNTLKSINFHNPNNIELRLIWSLYVLSFWFEKNEIEQYIKEFLQANDLKFPELGKPLRIILTGRENAPSISELLFILGKETSLKRIEYTLND